TQLGEQWLQRAGDAARPWARRQRLTRVAIRPGPRPRDQTRLQDGLTEQDDVPLLPNQLLQQELVQARSIRAAQPVLIPVQPRSRLELYALTLHGIRESKGNHNAGRQGCCSTIVS